MARYTSEIIGASFKTSPFIHQLRELEEHGLVAARALFWQMRTGKSKAIVDTACLAFTLGLIDTVIVFAPNGVHENWVQRELPLHHWDNVERLAYFWRTDQRDDPEFIEAFDAAMETKKKLSWFSFSSAVMTRDDVRKLVKKVVKKRRCMVVFDESHDWRSPGSKRTKMARALTLHCPMRRILTGTSADNSPLHLFTQYELLGSEALGFGTFEDFEERYAEYEMKKTFHGKQYPKLKEYKHLDELRAKIAPLTSVVLRTDCHDLPALVPDRRTIELTEEQKRVYRELQSQYRLELELHGKVSVGEKTQKMVKLQQVVSGYLKDEYGKVHWLAGGNPRLDAVKHEVLMSAGRVIVWCQFHEDLDAVAAGLRAIGREVLEYHGRTSSKMKEKARRSFDPLSGDGDYGPDLVAQAQAGGAGLALGADRIIWYSHTFSAITRQQADERATIMGGKNIRVTDFVAPGIDPYILDHVKKNVAIADALTRQGLREVLDRVSI